MTRKSSYTTRAIRLRKWHCADFAHIHFKLLLLFLQFFILSLSVPCSPQNISTNLSCGTNSLTVSWIPSDVPLNYTATAVLLGGNRSSVTCQTTGTSCSLSDLQCEQTYNVSVKASSSGSCTGPCSSPQTVKTGNTKYTDYERIKCPSSILLS